MAHVHSSLINIAWAEPPYVPGEPTRRPIAEARDLAEAAIAVHPEDSVIRVFYDELIRASEAHIEFERSFR